MTPATDSEPRFTVGPGYAVYRGPVTDSTDHRHAAFQIAIALRGEVVMTDRSATHRGVALVVAPMVRHRMLGLDDVLTFFIEPQSSFATRLRGRGAGGITAAPDLRGLRAEEIGNRPSADLDPRLLAAMAMVRDSDLTMPELAAAVGLSPQRLRALAGQQVGMPLARWRAWTRLQRAAEALRAGLPPARAAVVAGFADQAHLTRWMREMIGLTPGAVLPLLRDHSRRPT